jgi:hypothetical protein
MFLKTSCACRLGELVAWHLVGKRGFKADPSEGGGLGFDLDWWGLISKILCVLLTKLCNF